jgi:hypothetical protein
VAAALKRLWEAAQWRWTPFFGLVGGSLLYVLLVILIVPSKIGADKAKAGELVVIGDEPSPLNATMGGDSTRSPGARPFARQPSPMATEPGVGMGSEPPQRPEPMPPPQPIPIDPRAATPPPPEPPPPPPPPPQQQQEEEEEEEEQGANPGRPNRALAGALRMMPPPAVRPPAGPEPEPEPDEPDDEE